MAATIGKTVRESTPHWPEAPVRPLGINKQGAPNILVILFDDVGFSDFGCYGSPIDTPTIDRLAAAGLRYTGFHTTAMCSTTRAALLTGRNHHSVGMGCLANFDSGFPGYRGKIAREGRTLAEMLRPHGYRNYMRRQVARHAADRDRRRPARSTAGRSAAASTATTDSSTPRPTSTRPSWCATTRHVTAPGDYSDRLSPDRPTWSTRRSASSPTTSPRSPTRRGS